MRVDTIAGMAVSNLVALAIMISTAATLHAAGKTDIQTAAQAAQALQPLAGKFAFLLFSLGIIGTGMLAIPVLAGSAAYAVSETRDWKGGGLDNMPWEAKGFYHGHRRRRHARPDHRLFGARSDQGALLERGYLVNGVIAVPMMAAMMFVAGSRKKMGAFTAGPALAILGWASTLVMAAATVTMIYVAVT